MASYFSPKIELREGRIGKGLFAIAPIRKGDVVIDFTHGPGSYLTSREAWLHEHAGSHFLIQVDDNSFLSNLSGPEKGDFINHSCDPTCGIHGSVMIVAMRDIEPGEDIVFDYAMTESHPEYRMSCDCRTPLCRGVVTGIDWKNKVLQKRYGDYFSNYILEKIERHPLHQWALEKTGSVKRFFYWKVVKMGRAVSAVFFRKP